MNFIVILQIAVSLLIIVLILIQERASAGGGGGLFGGGGGEGFYQARRGLERFIFWLTVVLVAVFAGLALLNLVI